MPLEVNKAIMWNLPDIFLNIEVNSQNSDKCDLKFQILCVILWFKHFWDPADFHFFL